MFSSPPQTRSPGSPTSPTLRLTPIFTQGEHAIFNLTAAIEDALLATTNDKLEIISITCAMNVLPSNPWYTLTCVTRSDGKTPITTNYSFLTIASVDHLSRKMVLDFPVISVKADELTAMIAHGINQNYVLLSPLDPGVNHAVFISGEDTALGNWKEAERLNYNKTQQAWRLTLPKDIEAREYKFLTGSFVPGVKKTALDGLKWELQNGNRQLSENQCAKKTPRFGK